MGMAGEECLSSAFTAQDARSMTGGNKGILFRPRSHDISVHCEVLVWLCVIIREGIKRAKRKNHFVAKVIIHIF